MQRQSHSILEELMLPSIEQALFCKRKLHKCLIHRQYVTSLCHNFSSNIWWTSNKTQRFADLVSFVLSACISHGISLTFAVPDCRWKCASYWIYSESGVPLSSITFDCKATHCGPMHELWIQTAIAVLHRCGAE